MFTNIHVHLLLLFYLNLASEMYDGSFAMLTYCDGYFAASRIERECPNRHYVFERHAHKKLKLPVNELKEVVATNRTDCEDR